MGVGVGRNLTHYFTVSTGDLIFSALSVTWDYSLTLLLYSFNVF